MLDTVGVDTDRDMAALFRTVWPSRTFTISASRNTIGYTGSSGLTCQALTSPATASVMSEIVS